MEGYTVTTTTIVLYHYPCTDGAFAALAAYIADGDGDGRYAFIPHSTTRALDIPALRRRFPGDHITVHLLDYCGPGIPFMRELCDAFSEVLLIDHHQTARELLDQMEAAAGVYPRNLNAHVRQDRSGCTLARDHYRPALDRNLDVVFLYVEDNDLWKHELPDSKAFTAGLGALRLEYDFDAHPEALDQLRSAVSLVGVLERGRLELDARAARVAEAMRQAVWVRMEPWANTGSTGVYESPDDLIISYVSELGHALAGLSASQVGIVAWPLDREGRPGWVKLSLRSVCGVDTTTLSKAHGGGGHAVTRATWEAMKNGQSSC